MRTIFNALRIYRYGDRQPVGGTSHSQRPLAVAGSYERRDTTMKDNCGNDLMVFDEGCPRPDLFAAKMTVAQIEVAERYLVFSCIN